MDKLKDILAENMRRYNTKNLTEQPATATPASTTTTAPSNSATPAAATTRTSGPPVYPTIKLSPEDQARADANAKIREKFLDKIIDAVNYIKKPHLHITPNQAAQWIRDVSGKFLSRLDHYSDAAEWGEKDPNWKRFDKY
jgi:hypothetical protein